MKDKILDIDQPIVSLYPHHANLLSILGTNKYDLSILSAYYIQLVYNNRINRVDFNVGFEIMEFIKNYPLLIYHNYERNKIISTYPKFNEFIISCINEDEYTHFLVDTFYIKAYSEWYKKEHILHNIMIYGYSQKDRYFYSADCFERGKYSYKKVTFEEINESVINEFEYDWLEGIHTYKKKEQVYQGINFNIDIIKRLIEEYYNGGSSECITLNEKFKRDDSFFYGINIYKEICNNFYEESRQKKQLDHRTLCGLLEQKRYLLYLCKELDSIGILDRIDKHINNISLIIKRIEHSIMMLMKYNVTKNVLLIERLIILLNEIKDNDKYIMKEIYNNILEHTMKCYNYRVNGVHASSIAVDYVGEWKETEIKKVTVYVSKNINSKISYVFYGNEINVLAIKGRLYGKGIVYIDNCYFGEIDFFSYQEKVDIVYKCNTLSIGYHKIVIEKDNSNNKSINLIRFDIKINQNIKRKIQNLVCLVKQDNKTYGNWKKKYGSKGFEIVGDMLKIPEYTTSNTYRKFNMYYVSLLRTKGDYRALWKVSDNSKRVAAYFLNSNEFYIEVIISGEIERLFTLYFVDYDRLGRKQEILMTNFDHTEIYLKQEIKEFTKGIYIQYKIRGGIRVYIRCLQGPDAVISGIFFD